MRQMAEEEAESGKKTRKLGTVRILNIIHISYFLLLSPFVSMWSLITRLSILLGTFYSVFAIPYTEKKKTFQEEEEAVAGRAQ